MTRFSVQAKQKMKEVLEAREEFYNKNKKANKKFHNQLERIKEDHKIIASKIKRCLDILDKAGRRVTDNNLMQIRAILMGERPNIDRVMDDEEQAFEKLRKDAYVMSKLAELFEKKFLPPYTE